MLQAVLCMVAGFIISEANRLTGVWLLARCADLKGLGYEVTDYHKCLLMLFFIGAMFRCLALSCFYLLNKDKRR